VLVILKKKDDFNFSSCIVDLTISIAIGQLLFPQEITAEISIPANIYTIIASIIVIFLVSTMQKMDKKPGILFISIYLMPFLLMYSLITSIKIQKFQKLIIIYIHITINRVIFV